MLNARRGPSAPDDPDDVAAATEAAVRVLHGAAQTEVSLRRRLEGRGWSPGAARQAAVAMARHGYVDDSAFAQSLADRRLRGGYGRSRVAFELRARGVGEAPIDAALSAVGMSEERDGAMRVATRLLARDRARHGDADVRTAGRVAAALGRRGYDAQTVRSALRQVWDAGLPPGDDADG